MLRPISAKTRSVLLVCSKCTKKVGGGFGKKGNQPLSKQLRKLAGAGKGRKVELLVLETGCLKLCPKGSVVVVNGAEPQKWMIVPAGTEVSVIADQMGLSNL